MTPILYKFSNSDSSYTYTLVFDFIICCVDIIAFDFNSNEPMFGYLCKITGNQIVWRNDDEWISQELRDFANRIVKMQVFV